MRIKVIKPKTETELKRKRVCAYVRVSTDSLEQEDSLDNQASYFSDYIRSNPSWEFAGIYADQGISGFKPSTVSENDCRCQGRKNRYDHCKKRISLCKKYRDRAEVLQGTKKHWCRYFF